MKLIRGDELTAVVEEVTGPRKLIVAVNGQLFGVINQSMKKFTKGDQIRLVVRNTHPLEFQLKPTARTFGLDRVI